ncbi:MAG TPA: alpha/beta hydrolase [Blastocatellia bacterium]|nr:alpha/beta hydrolase [Blastocatellia bacterium]
MAKYIELNGIRTWYDEQGAGEPLVLLHPGGVGVDSRAFGPNLEALALHFRVLLPERRGHGHTPDTDDPYSYDLMAEDMIKFLERVVGGPARLLGVSDGAVVALMVAKKRPDLALRLICAAGVFHRSGWVASAIDPDNEPPEFLIDSYGKVSPDGKEHLPIVKKKLDQMHAEGPTLTKNDLESIACRTLVMVGDDDEVILEHAIDFYRAVPDGELAVVPGTSHGLLVEKPDLCNKIMVDFLTLDPVPTFAPIRRVR